MDRRISEKKAKYRNQIAVGRCFLLALAAMTLVNQLLLMLGLDYHFLVSAAVPYYLNWVCVKMGLSGLLPALAAVASLALDGLYCACWALSRRRRIWLTAALGAYALDTLLLIVFTFTMLENPSSTLLEILTHVGGLGLLAVADRAAGDLSRMRRSARRGSGV